MKTVIAALFISTCLSAAYARSAYQLPYGVELLRANLVTSFSCAGRPYGYYADVANDCTVFHVCQPVNDELGNIIEEAHFSFMCGNQTIFNQESLTCATVAESFPCEQAENLYELSNAEFGRIPEEDIGSTFTNTI